jgi:transposase
MPGNYRYISEERKKLVLTMSLRGMKTRDIEHATGIKCRTIRRFISMWKSTGEVVKHPLETGRPRVLTSLEVLVSHKCTVFSNNAILAEI